MSSSEQSSGRRVRFSFSHPRSRKGSETWGTPPTPKRFWQARFYDFNVWTERKRVEKLNYMHRNPVKRGLVALPEEWRWSSFRWYFQGEMGAVRVNDTEILLLKIRLGREKLSISGPGVPQVSPPLRDLGCETWDEKNYPSAEPGVPQRLAAVARPGLRDLG
jgi:hypothetical protein